jgi:alpha-ribazole phosphatase
MSRLVLVRHAEPQEDARGRCYGRLDVGLSPGGLRDAERLAGELAGTSYDAVYASPRLRAVATAEPVAAAKGLEVVVDADLRELDFGDFEGRRYEEIEQSEPELFRRWMETPTEVRFPNGEAYADLRERAVRVLDGVRARHACAVVVTHGGVIRAGVATWLRMPDDAIFRVDLGYCGVTVVDWLDGVPLVRRVNGGSDSVPA